MRWEKNVKTKGKTKPAILVMDRHLYAASQKNIVFWGTKKICSGWATQFIPVGDSGLLTFATM